MAAHTTNTFVQWSRITVPRVLVLAELAAFHTEREAARNIGISTDGLKSHVRDLKDITGCCSVRELGAWWVENRWRWLDVMAEFATGADRARGHDHVPLVS